MYATEATIIPAGGPDRASGADERFAAALAGYLTAVADHWAAVTTLAERTADRDLHAYADAVSAEADVRAAQAQARAAGAPAGELAVVFRLLAAVTLDRVAAWYQAGRPHRPAGLTAAEVALAGAARPAPPRRAARGGGAGPTFPGRPSPVVAVA
ncbi:hypothetical protein FDG2_1435 [Candidatus Protofrankia californiensis]|uniref:Uncharacterized protein n=1 Tax=Candidatus Protofrankia californiensis TaxID=1839754 RepID=A0A1C3NVL3_9ACTN|nr:hypothetical protein FDG2_1435 [Candidatus Protofrankia californiensis]